MYVTLILKWVVVQVGDEVEVATWLENTARNGDTEIWSMRRHVTTISSVEAEAADGFMVELEPYQGYQRAPFFAELSLPLSSMFYIPHGVWRHSSVSYVAQVEGDLVKRCVIFHMGSTVICLSFICAVPSLYACYYSSLTT